MICPTCSSEVNEGSNFCLKCGTPVNNAVSTPNVVNTNNTIDTGVTNNYNQPVENNYNQEVNVMSNFNNSVQDNISNNSNVAKESIVNKIKNKFNNMPNSVKKYGLIAVVVIAVVALFGIFGRNLFSSTSSDEINMDAINKYYDPDKPIPVKDGKLYGYISPSNGKVIIEAKYTDANEFYGDYAEVELEENGSTIYQLINRKGKVEFSSGYSSSIEYNIDNDCWIIDGALYNGKLKKITGDNIKITSSSSYDDYLKYSNSLTSEVGIMDYNGKIIYKSLGDSIKYSVTSNRYDEKDNYLFVQINGKDKYHVIYLKNNKEIGQVDLGSRFSIESGTTLVYSDNSKKEYYYFKGGKIIYQTSEELYDIDVYDYENDILKLDYGYSYDDKGKKQRYYYYDIKNKKTLTEVESNISYYTSLYNKSFNKLGFVKYEVNYSYGIMTKSKVLLPAIYDDIDFLNYTVYEYIKNKTGKQLVVTELDDKVSIVNMKNNKTLVTFDDDELDTYDSTFVKAKIYKDYNLKNYIVYNLLTDKSLTVDKNDTIKVYSNYITVTNSKNVVSYYNTKLEKIYERK